MNSSKDYQNPTQSPLWDDDNGLRLFFLLICLFAQLLLAPRRSVDLCVRARASAVRERTERSFSWYFFFYGQFKPLPGGFFFRFCIVTTVNLFQQSADDD
mmetsp:Transcript_14311/g.34601  ORF Transcript_14311/g.34601 Transcript_14311/m.34601 type:complete len:100 (-) Transcript_14311:46-345(-)